MDEHLILRNRLKTVRKEKKLSQTELAELVGVSRNTISSTPVYNFINGRLADKPTVLKPLS